MALDNKYFSFCKELGIMKENYSQQSALNTIINAVSKRRDADPAFIAAVSKLTLSSPEVSIRSCILYQYDIDVDYVVGGIIKNGNINEFGSSGVHDSLHITEWQGKGEYTVLKDVSSVPYAIYNNNNLFTYEEMKKALTKVIEKKVPSNCTSFQSKNWSVSAFIVPTLVIIMKYKGKEFQMYYNLHNGYYRYTWEENPALIAMGNKARTYQNLAKAGCLILAIIAALAGFSNTAGAGIFALIIVIAEIFIIKKTKKSKREFQKMFLENPDKKISSVVLKAIPMVMLSIFALIIALAA